MPQTPLGELTALPSDPLAGFKGPTSKEGNGWEERAVLLRERNGKGREREGREGPTSKGGNGSERKGEGKNGREGA